MPSHGRKFRDAREKVPVGVKLDPVGAVQLVKELSFAKFDETVEVATRLSVDPRKADQVVRGTVVLPHGTSKKVRVYVATQGEKEAEAREAGADEVGLELLEKIKEGWLEFDVMVATPDVMGKVGPLGRILGPRGLMPTPKAGTVTFDVAKAVTEIKAGKIEFRVDLRLGVNDSGLDIGTLDRQNINGRIVIWSSQDTVAVGASNTPVGRNQDTEQAACVAIERIPNFIRRHRGLGWFGDRCWRGG